MHRRPFSLNTASIAYPVLDVQRFHQHRHMRIFFYLHHRRLSVHWTSPRQGFESAKSPLPLPRVPTVSLHWFPYFGPGFSGINNVRAHVFKTLGGDGSHLGRLAHREYNIHYLSQAYSYAPLPSVSAISALIRFLPGLGPLSRCQWQ